MQAPGKLGARRRLAGLAIAFLVGAVVATGCTAAGTGPDHGGAASTGAGTGPALPAAGRQTNRAAAGPRPWSVSAVSAHRLWVLAHTRCGGSTCRAAVLRSEDGGTSWKRLDVPRVEFSPAPADRRGVGAVTFANARDGWLYGPTLWATHDGGETWTRVRLPGRVEKLAVGAGVVWVLVGDCTTGHGCSSYTLMRSALDGDHFTEVRFPEPLEGHGPGPDLAVAGRTVMLLESVPAPRGGHDRIEQSTDGGASWKLRPAPCTNELGGRLSAVGETVWVACPAGSLAAVYLSAGGRFAPVQVFGGPLPSFTTVTAVTSRTAFVVMLGARMVRTSDAGGRWRRVQVPPQARGGVAMELAFPDPGHGYAVSVGAGTGRLLHTDDGGRHWEPVPLR